MLENWKGTRSHKNVMKICIIVKEETQSIYVKKKKRVRSNLKITKCRTCKKNY